MIEHPTAQKLPTAGFLICPFCDGQVNFWAFPDANTFSYAECESCSYTIFFPPRNKPHEHIPDRIGDMTDHVVNPSHPRHPNDPESPSDKPPAVHCRDCHRPLSLTTPPFLQRVSYYHCPHCHRHRIILDDGPPPPPR